MKINRSILTAALLAFTGTAALALTVPVLQDSTATSGKFLKGAGNANTLSVSVKQAAYVKFDLFNAAVVPGTIGASNIVSANLRIYVGKAKVAGDLQVHTLLDAWEEGATGTAPGIDAGVIATFPAAQVATKDFVVVDVTDFIRETYNVGIANGFAITAAGTTKVTLGSKEGAASGYPCELNIETNYASDGSGGGTFTGNGTFGGNVLVDNADGNDGTLTGALLFGSEGLEGIGSKRTSGGNQYGLDFYSNGANLMSLTTGGKLGIGTTTPESKLELVGPADIELTLQSTDNNRRWSLQASGGDEAGGGTAGTFQIVDRTSTASRLAITPSGRVGIGTVTPEDLLHVAAASSNRMLVSAADAGSAGYRQRNSVHEYFTGISGPGAQWYVYDNTNSVTRLIIAPTTGNIGIGTEAPAAKLDVRGDVKLGANGQFFASSGEENLRVIRGFIVNNATIGKGSGFTVARKAGAPVGHYVITFTTPFSDLPTITVTPNGAVANVTAILPNFFPNNVEVQVYLGGALVDANFNFIAVGPR